MTHAELVVRAMRWLRSTMKHPIVVSEIKSAGSGEEPDVIGWKRSGFCSLIECKASRADYARDKTKHFRSSGGMGEHRWYATPPGLLKPNELPLRWGLIEVGPKLVRIVYRPSAHGSLDRNVRGETQCLVSALERATDGWGRKVFGEISPAHGRLDPHPSVSAALKAHAREASNARRQLERAREKVARLEEELAELKKTCSTVGEA